MTGDKIRAARKSASLTQVELAKMIGVKHSVISKYENGTIDPTTSQLQRIASALHVSVDYFFSSTDLQKNKYQWADEIEGKLQCIGVTVDGYDDGSKIWLNLPDGTLDVSFEELESLNQRADSYLRFLLSELKQANPAKFTHRSNRDIPSQDPI